MFSEKFLDEVIAFTCGFKSATRSIDDHPSYWLELTSCAYMQEGVIVLEVQEDIRSIVIRRQISYTEIELSVSSPYDLGLKMGRLMVLEVLKEVDEYED